MNAALRYTIYVLFVGSSIQFPLCSLCLSCFKKTQIIPNTIFLINEPKSGQVPDCLVLPDFAHF